MLCIGNFEENMDLSRIYLAVRKILDSLPKTKIPKWNETHIYLKSILVTFLVITNYLGGQLGQISSRLHCWNRKLRLQYLDIHFYPNPYRLKWTNQMCGLLSRHHWQKWPKIKKDMKILKVLYKISINI